ncbi:hypothetical protein MLD38_011828 [Melastoma candidum]|uniref:Uncharacterized protein n=1 Tax=Melastoma candidum TaxID=119954 RepID=A0ACB9R5M4_9MYRT|nr:hypothetical protein MLD38_011828 [Melastoma candidum]
MPGTKMFPATAGPPLPIVDSDGRTLRAYQAWKGNNRFYFGGRIMLGPDAGSLFWSVFLIIAPVVLFCMFESQWLVEEFNRTSAILIAAISVLIAVLILVLLFLTAMSDPGIIPRNAHPPELEDDADGSSLSADWSGPSSLPPTKDVLVNGIIVKVKYCQTCMLHRPPRCSHCSICNNCVDRFDHHCPWVGQCIGKRNYRFFFMFITSTTALCIYVFAFCWVNIIWIMHKFECSLGKAFTMSPVSGILILYTFIVTWFVGGLTSFHLYLISTNQTTYENCRYRYDSKSNPHNLGCIRNIFDVLFSEVPPSKNDFRAEIEKDPSSEHHTSLSVGHSPSPMLLKENNDREAGKREGVAAKDSEGMQTQINRISGLEICSNQPPRENWDGRQNLEITPDVKVLDAEFGKQYSAPKDQNQHREP